MKPILCHWSIFYYRSNQSYIWCRANVSRSLLTKIGLSNCQWNQSGLRALILMGRVRNRYVKIIPMTPSQPAFTFFKANNGSTRAMCESCLKWPTKTSESRHGASIVEFRQVNAGWVMYKVLDQKINVLILSGK